MSELTQEKLKEIFDYDPETGVFIYLERPRHHFKDLPSFGWWLTNDLVGKVAGSESTGGYRRVMIDKRGYFLHRLAWLYVYGEMPKVIDHINGIASDNRIANIRNVSLGANSRNRKLGKNNTSGVMGVSWNINAKKWKVTIFYKGKNINLGYYSDIKDAEKVRAEADIKYGYHANHGRDLTNSN